MKYNDCDIDTHPFEREVLKVPQYNTNKPTTAGNTSTPAFMWKPEAATAV
jgi:hypothetical protein